MQTTKLTTVLVLTGLFLGLMVPSVAAWGSSGGEGAQADQEQGNQGLLGFSFAVTDQDNTQRATQRGSSRASGGSGDDNVVSINDQDLTQDSDQRATTRSGGSGLFSFGLTDQDSTQRANQRGSSSGSGGSGDDNVVSINDQDLTQDSDQRASTFSFGGGFPW